MDQSHIEITGICGNLGKTPKNNEKYWELIYPEQSKFHNGLSEPAYLPAVSLCKKLVTATKTYRFLPSKGCKVNGQAIVYTVFNHNNDCSVVVGGTATASVLIPMIGNVLVSGSADVEYTAVTPIVTCTYGSNLWQEDVTGPEIIDEGVTITDGTSTFTQAKVRITTGYESTYETLALPETDDLTSSFETITGILTITGDVTRAAMQAALQTVTFDSSTQNPIGSSRVVTYQVWTGDIASNVASKTLFIAQNNDRPVMTVDLSPLVYTENDAPTAVFPGATLTDADDALIGYCQVGCGGWVAGQDVFTRASADGITWVYNATFGTLVGSGNASVATYLSHIQSITYHNTSVTPNTGDRTVSIYVRDSRSAQNTPVRERVIQVIAI